MMEDSDFAHEAALDIPLDWNGEPMAVCSDLASDTVNVLAAHVARFAYPQGGPAEAQGYFRLMTGTTAVLAGLFDALAARQSHDGARELVLMVQNFLDAPHAADHLDAIRGAWNDVDPAVVDALKALHWQIQKQRMERSATQRRGQTGAGDGTTSAAGANEA